MTLNDLERRLCYLNPSKTLTSEDVTFVSYLLSVDERCDRLAPTALWNHQSNSKQSAAEPSCLLLIWNRLPTTLLLIHYYLSGNCDGSPWFDMADVRYTQKCAPQRRYVIFRTDQRH